MPHVGGREAAGARAQPRGPAGEIRLVVRHEVGEGGCALGVGRWIKNDRDEPGERIVLDHDNGRIGHCACDQLFLGSVSTLSAVNTRLCMM